MRQPIRRVAHDHLIVWGALMRPLIDEVAGSVPKAVLRRMEGHHTRFGRLLDELARFGTDDERLDERVAKSREIAMENFDFFASLTELTGNPPLRAALEGEQHILRLGSLALPEWIDVAGLGDAQARLLDGLRAGDRGACQGALDAVLRMVVPGA